ncbi:MAG: hypothetical protein H0U74_16385 [Bradymonadaceae bacterium]|nr:hypothetical protein [Lujinxingiaceae bacterium]
MSSELSATFLDHFSFLCASDEDRELLAALAERIEKFTNDHGAVSFTIGAEEVSCNAPFKGLPHAETPASYAALASHHNGITWESAGGGALGFFGLDEKGRPDDFGFFESHFIEEGGNEDFIEALEGEDLSAEDLEEAYGCGQNWIIFDPLRESALGEPALAFVSHEDCEWQPMLSADELSAAGVTLRLLAYYFNDDDSLEEINC